VQETMALSLPSSSSLCSATGASSAFVTRALLFSRCSSGALVVCSGVRALAACGIRSGEEGSGQFCKASRRKLRFYGFRELSRSANSNRSGVGFCDWRKLEFGGCGCRSLQVRAMAVATTADHQQRLENPLLQESPFPLYDAVEAKHVIPGIKTILQDLEKEVDELEEKVEPTWEALVQPLEKIKDRLTVAWGTVSHLKAVKDSPELREAVETVQVLTVL
jgi:hypothetical protein